MSRQYVSLLTTVACAALLCNASTAFAQGSAPTLGAAQSFAVLSGTASVSNSGPTVLNGDLGTSGGAGITGFGGVAPNNGLVNGSTHNADAVAIQAQVDVTGATGALVNLQGQPCTDSVGAIVLGVATFLRGVHCFTSSLGIGTITLDAQNDPNAIFIFKIGSSLTAGVGSSVTLINGAQACNVYWAIVQDATVGGGATFVGNILAGRDISVGLSSHLFGRALAGRAITLLTDVVDATVCSGVIPGAPCVAATTPPTITSIPSQVIPTLPVGGSVAVGFSISGAVIPSALRVTATSSNQTLVGQDGLVLTGNGSARLLTIRGADGRTGVTTITVTVTDPTVLTCSTSTSFQLTIGAAAVPTLPEWAMIALTALLALAGFAAVRRRAT